MPRLSRGDGRAIFAEVVRTASRPSVVFSAPQVDRPMFRVSRDIPFCYGHRLLNYEGKCRHLHGHNGIARIVLGGDELDHRGMLVDFSDIKRAVQRWIDDTLDHNMLLCRDDPMVEVLRERGERLFVMDDNPTAENIAKLIYEHAREAGLPVAEVILWETDNCSATYRGTGAN